jgi:hypothetical protein
VRRAAGMSDSLSSRTERSGDPGSSMQTFDMEDPGSAPLTRLGRDDKSNSKAVGMRWARWIIAAGLLAPMCFGAPAIAPAQADEELVYWPFVTDGTEYRRVAYPRAAGTLVVLAGSQVVIEVARANVSYWPITREYLADFSQQPRMEDARIEIEDRSGKTTLVEPELYLVWYPAGVGEGSAEIVRGDRVSAFYEDYVQAARTADQKAREHQRLVAEHHAAVAAWLKIAAERRESLPPPPPELHLEEPEPFRAYATKPRRAAVISLPEGTYRIRATGATGEVIPGSERELVSFGPRDEGIGYVVRPEDRWTQPLSSFAPDEAVYTTSRTDLFLQPLPVVEYGARDFARLFRPQSIESPDPSSTVWVPQEDREGAAERYALALRNGTTVLETLARTPYRVAQRPGTSRGYVVEAFAPERGNRLQPDFFAMRLGQDLPVTQVSVLDRVGGGPAASARSVRRVDPPAEPWLYVPALIPLIVGAVHATLRRTRLRTSGTRS